MSPFSIGAALLLLTGTTAVADAADRKLNALANILARHVAVAKSPANLTTTIKRFSSIKGKHLQPRNASRSDSKSKT